MKRFLLAAMLCLPGAALAQDAADYAVQADMNTGTAPGLKATELNPRTRRFQIIFAKGDDVRAGLTDFAIKNNLTVANFTAIGALDSAVIGWSDPDKKAFKIIRLEEEMEVTSMTGNITRDAAGKPVVHVHLVVALLRNGNVYAGHLLKGRVSITMQLYLDDSAPAAK